MKIGIDASRAFLKNRTGVEEYSYQVIKYLMDKLEGHEVVLYVRQDPRRDPTPPAAIGVGSLQFPENWKIKFIKFPYLWTQIGLSLEMFLHPVDMLFVPAHTVPFVHPENTIVTVHGLEYEFCPEAYSWWEKFYMRLSIKNSCRWAKKIIAVSQNTKNDLVNLYKVLEEKIAVIYEGISPFRKGGSEGGFKKINEYKNPSLTLPLGKGEKSYLLFIGRLEERKNIIGIIKAFEILKEHYKIPHKLVLAGKFGYGAEKIKEELKNINCGSDIILPGFISEEEKWELLKNVDVFLFPTFYEGFGIPILEAQSMGVPVVAGNNSSIQEIVKIPPNPPLGKGGMVGRGRKAPL